MTYLIALLLGLLVAIFYAVFDFHTPAPPVIALFGLLGILFGEQILLLIEKIWTRGDRRDVDDAGVSADLGRTFQPGRRPVKGRMT